MLIQEMDFLGFSTGDPIPNFCHLGYPGFLDYELKFSCRNPFDIMALVKDFA